MTAATATKPEVGDRVKVVLEGKYDTSPFGDHYVIKANGEKVYVASTVAKHLEIVEKGVPEPPLGTVVQIGLSGDKFVRTSGGKWRHVNNGDTASQALYTWEKVLQFAKGLKLYKLVGQPIDTPKAVDINNKRYMFQNADGTWTDYKVCDDGRLYNDDTSYCLKRAEAVKLARAILAANGLNA